MKILALPISFTKDSDEVGTKPIFTVEFANGRVVGNDAEELLDEYDLSKVTDANAQDFLAALANDIRGVGVRITRVRVPSKPREGFELDALRK